MVIHSRKRRAIRSEKPPLTRGCAVFKLTSIVQGAVVVHPNPSPVTVALRISQVVIDFKGASGVGLARTDSRDARSCPEV